MAAVLPPVPPADPRTQIQAVLGRAFFATDNFHKEARAFRNRLVIMSAIVLLTAGAVVLLQWRLPKAVLITQPTGSGDLPRWALLLIVMAFGCIGALITTIPAISKIPRAGSWFNFPLQQAILKILVGSLTALVGVILTSSSSVTKGITSLEALVGVAIVFGAAQQAVTQLLDTRAKGIIQDGKPGDAK